MTDRKKLQSYDLVNEDKQEQPYSDGPKAHYIKTDGNNLEGDGVLSPEEIVKYQSAKYLFLITEDDDVQQGILEGNLRRSINPRTLDDTLILTASSVKEASDLLGKCRQYAPSASLVVSLDYHMGQNDPGERTPTEVLFKNEDLIHYLTKGPVAAVSYTGYPAAVMQSPAIQEAIGTYQDFAFFVADYCK